jgi:hypothetical protein
MTRFIDEFMLQHGLHRLHKFLWQPRDFQVFLQSRKLEIYMEIMSVRLWTIQGQHYWTYSLKIRWGDSDWTMFHNSDSLPYWSKIRYSYDDTTFKEF